VTERVLDASALLAYLQRESNADRVETLLLDHPCLISAVNLAETLARLADWNIPLALAEARILGLEIAVIPFDQAFARQAAELRAPTRKLGLSLGDRACLALARARGAVAVTADRAWLKLDAGIGVEIDCIRGDIQ
jgi:PIN domain nuclease of toxin-antitoxin system